jgi:hypothetical protein
VYQDGDSEEMDAAEVIKFIDNSRVGVFSTPDKESCDHINGFESQSDVILEFCEAIKQKNIPKIASTMFDDEKYEMLLSPLSSRHLATASTICGDISYTSLHQAITMGESFIDNWKSTISTGDLIDIYRQRYGQWYLARITDLHREENGQIKSMKIHYMYWNSKYDEIISRTELEFLRISPPNTLSPCDYHRRKYTNCNTATLQMHILPQEVLTERTICNL